MDKFDPLQNLKKLRVFILDDSRSFIAGVKSIIDPYIGEVVTFTSQNQAIASFFEKSPDIFMTDLEMPEMNGIQVMKTIRENSKYDSIPMIVLTGKEDAATMSEVILAGADSFLAKSTLRETVIPQLIAMSRLRYMYQKSVKGNQLDAIQNLIGTYKHEFGNAITIIEGKVHKLIRENPNLTEAETVIVIKKWISKMIDVLDKLNKLRSYEQEDYVGESKILKVG